MSEWTGKSGSPLLYAKASSGAVTIWHCWTEGAEVVVEWGQEDGSMQTKRFKCKPKNKGRANATTASEQAEKEAHAKFAKQLKKKYFLSKEAALTTLNYKPMLASKYLERVKRIKFPVDVQTKLNGVRCLARRGTSGDVELMSRGGDPYNVPHVRAAFEDSLDEREMMDGELYHHGTSLQTITSWAKRTQPDTANLVFNAYDTVDMELPEEPWEARRGMLTGWFNEHGSTVAGAVELVATTLAHTHDQVQELHDMYVRMGYEGAIIRLHHGVYRFGYRSLELLKFKEFDDAEFEVVGWTIGKGDWENVPIFMCATKDGKEFEAPPKGSMVARAQMLKEANSYIGRQMTVRYFGFTDAGVPSLPVGYGIREEGT